MLQHNLILGSAAVRLHPVYAAEEALEKTRLGRNELVICGPSADGSLLQLFELHNELDYDARQVCSTVDSKVTN